MKHTFWSLAKGLSGTTFINYSKISRTHILLRPWTSLTNLVHFVSLALKGSKNSISILQNRTLLKDKLPFHPQQYLENFSSSYFQKSLDDCFWITTVSYKVAITKLCAKLLSKLNITSSFSSMKLDKGKNLTAFNIITSK